MTILNQYPFAVRRFGESYGNPVAVAREATKTELHVDAESLHIFSQQTVTYETINGTVSFQYTDAMLNQTKAEVQDLLAACDWPASKHNMMTGAEWQWLVIKHVRGLL